MRLRVRFTKAVGQVKQHMRMVGGKRVQVQQHQRQFEGARPKPMALGRREGKVKVRFKRPPPKPQKPAAAPEARAFEALPDVAHEQFKTAYTEHVGATEKQGRTPLTEQEAKQKFTRDFHIALDERTKYDSARTGLESKLKELYPDKPVFGRTKTPESMAGKLVRKGEEDFSALADIAGSTIVVGNMAEQEAVLETLRQALKPYHSESWNEKNFDDYLSAPKFGYRAIHFIVNIDGKAVELQLKTKNQKAWSELSHTTFYSKVDNPLKGNEAFGRYMNAMSEWLAKEDREIDPGPKPPCDPPIARRLGMCL